MSEVRLPRQIRYTLVLASIMLATTGCQRALLVKHGPPALPLDGPQPACAPRELHKAILPLYTIEPPDLLVIGGIGILPKSPYNLRVLDELAIDVANAPVEAPIQGAFVVQLGGNVNLGAEYGNVKVLGLTVEEALAAIENHLEGYIPNLQISVSLSSIGSQQEITGEHLVAPDGRITLGSYGSVLVVGMTKDEARQAIEEHLSEFLEDPKISLDVIGYNSKVYYVISQGAGLGDSVIAFPSTGNETVLDAIAGVNGLTEVSSKEIWIARPGPNSNGCDQILPVDWLAITQRGNIETNYQVLPGDRVYVSEDKLISFDNQLAKIIAPLERIMGFTILTTETVTRLSGKVLRGGGNPRGRF